MRLWVAGLSLLTATLSGCMACSCMGEMTIKNKFCAADFVLKVRVLSTLVNPDDDVNTMDAFYPVKVLHTYKAPEGGSVGEWEFVFTAGNGALCGLARLRPGEYILGGSLYHGNMRLDLCSSLVAGVVPGLDSNLADVLNNPPPCPRPM